MRRTHGPRLTEVPLGAGARGVLTEAAGGASAAPWAPEDGGGLDLGLATGDDPDVVRANRRALSGALGVPVAFATQVHGADVVEVTDLAAGGTDTVGEADGLVTRVPGLALAVLVADCVPVLLADGSAGVVGVAHAGRRGVVADVVGAVLDAMRDLGADPARVRAVVGPSACGACYEVPAEMRADVARRAPAAWSTTRRGTAGLDLPAAVAARLDELGAGAVHVDGRCTIEDPELFSHRRATAPGGPGVTGRTAGVVHLLAR